MQETVLDGILLHLPTMNTQLRMRQTQRSMCKAQMTMAQGQRSRAQGQRSMGQGQRSTGQGQRSMGDGQRSMGQSQRSMAQSWRGVDGRGRSSIAKPGRQSVGAVRRSGQGMAVGDGRSSSQVSMGTSQVSWSGSSAGQAEHGKDELLR